MNFIFSSLIEKRGCEETSLRIQPHTLGTCKFIIEVNISVHNIADTITRLEIVLTIIVIDLVFSSIMMFPYCKSLWQNTTSWGFCDKSFSTMSISSANVSRWNSFAHSLEHKFLALVSQFLGDTKFVQYNLSHKYASINKQTKLFLVILTIPHPVPENYIFWTRHIKSMKFPQFSCNQSRGFRITKITSW